MSGQFTIRPYQQSTQMNESSAMETWSSLDAAITQIHEQNASQLSFEELYSKAYNMVLYKHGDVLYKKLEEKVSSYLEEVCQALVAVDNSELLGSIIKHWTAHTLSMGMVRDILMYMDRTYVPKQKLDPVYEKGLKLWLKLVLRNPAIQQQALGEALSCISRERNNEDVDRITLRKFSQMYSEIPDKQAYTNDFEKPMLNASRIHFRASSQEFISTNSVSAYLEKAEQWIESEGKRADSFLDTATKPKLLSVIYEEVLLHHLPAMLQNETSVCVAMLRDEQWEVLGKLYSMLRLCESKYPTVIDKLAATISDYITRKGLEYVHDSSQTSDAVVYIQGLIQMRVSYSKLVQTQFQRDKAMVKMLNSAFEHFVNDNQRSPEYLSLYIDEKMRKGLSGMTDDEVEEVLTEALDFFRSLQEKDLFERYYKQHLARRLLSGKSEDNDHESTFLRKLKQECGVQFTSKLEGMFSDTRSTHDMIHEFKEHVSSNPEVQAKMHGIDLSVNVLTTGFWPKNKCEAIALPPQVQSACDQFTAFYLTKFETRRLEFKANMGHVDLRLHMAKKRYNLNVPVNMMVILMLFNNVDELTYKQISEATKINKSELDRALVMLSLAKLKILGKQPKSKEIQDTDVFSFNNSFSAPHTKLKIQAHKSSGGERDTLPTRSAILEDRKHEIDAALVRIMKARNQMNHNQLTGDAIIALTSRFKADPRDIKKRIENLIEREFLERVPGDNKMYKYMP